MAQEELSIRQIEEVTSWTAEGYKSADHIQLYNFHNYNFDSSDSSRVSYRLFLLEEQIIPGPDGEPTARPVKTVLLEGSVNIPDSVVQAWGEDDEPIFDYVIGELGLVKVI